MTGCYDGTGSSWDMVDGSFAFPAFRLTLPLLGISLHSVPSLSFVGFPFIFRVAGFGDDIPPVPSLANNLSVV